MDLSKIFRKINSNAYIVDLSSDFGISPSVNIEDLVTYKGSIFSPDKLLLNKPSPEPTFERPSLPPLSQRKSNHTTEQINKIINDQIVSTRDGGYQKFLVRWKGLTASVSSWIDRVELQWLDSDCLEHYESGEGLHSTG